MQCPATTNATGKPIKEQENAGKPALRIGEVGYPSFTQKLASCAKAVYG